jgi:hypothetical protein
MTVEVTAEDIAKGRRNDCNRCPIAIAIKRSAGCAFASAAPGVAFVSIDLDGGSTRYRLPREASLFINDFDRYAGVDPFSFDMERAPL